MGVPTGGVETTVQADDLGHQRPFVLCVDSGDGYMGCRPVRRGGGGEMGGELGRRQVAKKATTEDRFIYSSTTNRVIDQITEPRSRPQAIDQPNDLYTSAVIHFVQERFLLLNLFFD